MAQNGNGLEKKDSDAGSQDFLNLDFESHGNKGKFPGGPVPDTLAIAREIMEQRSRPPEQETAETETPAPIQLEEKGKAEEKEQSPPAQHANHDNCVVSEREPESRNSGTPRKRIKAAGIKPDQSASLGRILHEARISCGLSFKDVEEETRIRAAYIEALEHNNLKELPPPVYVRAYIRNLCNLYQLDNSALEELLENHCRNRRDNLVSEEIFHQMEKDRHSNPEEETRVKRMILTVAGSATALLILIIASIFFMFSTARNGAGRAAPPIPEIVTPQSGLETASFDQETFEKLRAPRMMDMEKIGPRTSEPRLVPGDVR